MEHVKDPWNSTAEEIRRWAFDPDATCEQDWDLAVLGIGHDEVVLDLAADENCPKRHFFLRCLYLLMGDFVRSKHRDGEVAHVSRLLDSAEKSGDDLVAIWAARSRELISHPEQFDYNQWCLGNLAVDHRISIHFDDQAPPIQCERIEEVDAALDRLHANADPTNPLSVAICFLGVEINTGLGTDPTFVCIQIGDFNGDYYVAVGEETEGDGKTFHGAGQQLYWERKNLIPLASARAAVRYFVEFQERISTVRWTNRDGEDV